MGVCISSNTTFSEYKVVEDPQKFYSKVEYRILPKGRFWSWKLYDIWVCAFFPIS